MPRSQRKPQSKAPCKPQLLCHAARQGRVQGRLGQEVTHKNGVDKGSHAGPTRGWRGVCLPTASRSLQLPGAKDCRARERKHRVCTWPSIGALGSIAVLHCVPGGVRPQLCRPPARRGVLAEVKGEICKLNKGCQMNTSSDWKSCISHGQGPSSPCGLLSTQPSKCGA